MGIFAVHPEAAGSPKAMAKLDEKMEQSYEQTLEVSAWPFSPHPLVTRGASEELCEASSTAGPEKRGGRTRNKYG